jgi:hypothetical protein
MMNGDVHEIVMNNIKFDDSIDGKSIRLTVYKMGEKIEDELTQEESLPVQQEISSNKRRVKSLWERIFKQKKKD